MQIKTKSNIKSEIKAFQNLVKDFKKEFNTMADSAIKEFAADFKQKVLDLVKSQKVSETQVRPETLALVRQNNFFKYEKDLISAVFGEDLAKIAINSENIAYNTFGLNSNIHVMQNGYIRSFRRIGKDSTLSETLQSYKNSLNSGLILDKDTGEIFILGEELSDNYFDSGIKLFCTTSRGVTPWSEEVFSKYKRGDRKVSGLGDGELAVPLTIKQVDLKRHLKKAIPLGKIQDLIMEGKYDQAKAILSQAGPQRFKEAAQKIEEMKVGGENLPQEAQDLNKVIKTVKDVKVAKYVKQQKVDYKLKSTLAEGFESTSSKELFDQIYPVLIAYIPDLEEKIVKDIVKAIEEIVKKYGASKT